MHVLNILWVVFGIGLMLVLNLGGFNQFNGGFVAAALSVGMLAGMDLMSLLHTVKAGHNTLGNFQLSSWCSGAVIGKLMSTPAAHQISAGAAGASPVCAWRTAVSDYHRLVFGLAMF